MFKLTALMMLAGLGLSAPAQAQVSILENAIRLGFQNNNACDVSALSITPGKDASELRFSFQNKGSTAIAFGLQMTIAGTSGSTSFSRNFAPAANSGPRQPGQGVFLITGISPPLPALTNATAMITLVNCAAAQINRPLAPM